MTAFSPDGTALHVPSPGRRGAADDVCQAWKTAQAGGSVEGTAKVRPGPLVLLRCAAAAMTGAALTFGVGQQFPLPSTDEFTGEVGVRAHRSAFLLWSLLSRERCAGRGCALFRRSRNAGVEGRLGVGSVTDGPQTARVALRCPGAEGRAAGQPWITAEVSGSCDPLLGAVAW